MELTIEQLIERMLKGEQRSLSRLISQVENESPDVPRIMRGIHPHLGKAYSIGVTGPPGAGKSTLVDKLTGVIRSKGLTVGILAVDPTSPFSGGAVLGDRIRMQQHYLDSGVFIRSMASRGSLGGLPGTTRNVMKLMDAFGKDIILVETVGVGQTELDIMNAVDTTIVALVPEAGDTIQMMKAGLMEIADVFVINKADRPGADQLMAGMQSMLYLNAHKGKWQPPVLSAQAANNVGIAELYGEAEKHREFLQSSGDLLRKRQQQRREEFFQAIDQNLRKRLSVFTRNSARLKSLLDEIERGETDPYSAMIVMEEEAIAKGYLPKRSSD